MGFIDSIPFIGTFAILEDLTDCSSDTVTYVERRRSSGSQDKSKAKSKQSTTTAARPPERVHAYASSKHAAGGAITVKGPETARSTTVANLNVKDEDTKLRETRTNVSAKRSIANETVTKHSIVTAPPILGRSASRLSRREGREEEGQKNLQKSQKEPEEQATKGDTVDVEVITNTKETIRSLSRLQARSREPWRAPVPSEAETKHNVSLEELHKENRALRRRTDRLEKDLASYRRHAEHYRERRREVEREKLKAEERVRELETVVTNMRDSYELELEDLRGQITEYVAKASAMASATQIYGKDITGGTEGQGQSPPSKQEAGSKSPTEEKAPDMHDESIQTDPWPPRPPSPVPATSPATAEGSRGSSLLLAKLEQRDAELSALRLFHEETPQIPLDTLANSVRALNLELRNLAASMATNVPLGRTWEVAQAWALEAAEPGLSRCLHLLSGVKGADFGQDVTLVRLALQAWIVSSLQRVFERFLFGLDNAEDEMLRRVFERVQARESPAVAARWRALAHRHARTLATLPIASPSTSGGGFAAARDHAVHLLEMDILVGAEAILRFAGAHSPPGVLLSELSTAHGRRISRLVKRAARLASDLAERAPMGCEVFTVHVGDDSDHAQGGTVLCGCMESIDQECRQWVGQTAGTVRGGRTAGTRTRTNTRAGTARNKSKTRTPRSHARTATTRTWADTNIRQWDKDSDEEIEEESEEEDEVAEGEDGEEDQFVENVDVGLGGEGQTEGEEKEHPTVLCSLGFGLRRVIRRPIVKRKSAQAGASSTHPGQESLQKERRRMPKPNVETIHGTESDAKSTFTLTSLTTSTRTRRQRQHQGEASRTRTPRTAGTGIDAREPQEGEGTIREGTIDGREVEVLVKTDVLVSSTVDSLRNRVVQ